MKYIRKIKKKLFTKKNSKLKKIQGNESKKKQKNSKIKKS